MHATPGASVPACQRWSGIPSWLLLLGERLVNRQTQRSQSVAQRRAVEAEQFTRLRLMPVRVSQHPGKQDALDRGDHLLVQLRFPPSQQLLDQPFDIESVSASRCRGRCRLLRQVNGKKLRQDEMAGS